MSSFNVLITKIQCPECGMELEARIQFKFGNTWQLRYKIGDTIKWGGNDIGSSDLKKVKVYGIIESTTCPFCSKDSIAEEYDIFIKENVIVNVSPIKNTQDYLTGNGEYIVLE